MLKGLQAKLGIGQGTGTQGPEADSTRRILRSHQIGACVRIVGGGGPATPEQKNILAVVVRTPLSDDEDAGFEVELYAPTEAYPASEESNGGPCGCPFLTRQRVVGLRAAQLYPCTADDDEGLTVVCKLGAAMCAVPLAELHARGLGMNVEGRSARLGGLASRQDLHGACTITRGPDDDGRYTVGCKSAVLFVRPECLTLWIRRDALWELVSELSTLKRKVPHIGTIPGEIIEPHPELQLSNPGPETSSVIQDLFNIASGSPAQKKDTVPTNSTDDLDLNKLCRVPVTTQGFSVARASTAVIPNHALMSHTYVSAESNLFFVQKLMNPVTYGTSCPISCCF